MYYNLSQHHFWNSENKQKRETGLRIHMEIWLSQRVHVGNLHFNSIVSATPNPRPIFSISLPPNFVSKRKRCRIHHLETVATINLFNYFSTPFHRHCLNCSSSEQWLYILIYKKIIIQDRKKLIMSLILLLIS